MIKRMVRLQKTRQTIRLEKQHEVSPFIYTSWFIVQHIYMYYIITFEPSQNIMKKNHWNTYTKAMFLFSFLLDESHFGPFEPFAGLWHLVGMGGGGGGRAEVLTEMTSVVPGETKLAGVTLPSAQCNWFSPHQPTAVTGLRSATRGPPLTRWTTSDRPG